MMLPVRWTGRETGASLSNEQRKSPVEGHSDASCCMPWLEGSITNMFESEFPTQPSGLVTVPLQLSNCDLYHGNCIHELVLIWSGRNRQRENRP